VIERGDTAPDFELPDQDGVPVRLSDFRGQPLILYFHPKADTPGCTTQACGVRDHLRDYTAGGAVVLGASSDPVARVKRFHDKQGLNFRLLADEDHSVAET
jgi:thioredoxin-dependent peroxiredoxin